MASSPLRRVTRSQSRERETSGGKDKDARPSWTQSKGRMTGKTLEAVLEESPYRSPRKSTSRAAPESPEDATYISGTTAVNTTQMPDAEPETDPASEPTLDAEMMLYTLPDLEATATNVLDFITPAAKDGGFAALAKKLADPHSLPRLQFQRRVSKLTAETQNFSHATYINVDHVRDLFFRLFETRGSGAIPTTWSAVVVLHKANCAHLARETLLAATDWAAFRRAVATLNHVFPSAFMNDIVHAAASQARPIGESALAKETFQLALELRTQALVMRIEDHQRDAAFDAADELKEAFFREDPGDAASPDVASPLLRGFDLDGFGGMDGVLPSRFRDAAWERYTDVRDVLESEDDMTVVVRILKPMYRWQKFAPRAVEWVCKRLDEINEDLLRQPSTEEFHHAFFTSTEELETGVEDSQAGRDSIQETPAREEQPAPAEPQPEPEPAPASEPEPAPEPAPRRRDDHYSPRKYNVRYAEELRRTLALTRRDQEGGTSDDRPTNTSSERRRISTPARQVIPPTPPRATQQEIPASPEPDDTLFVADGEDLHLNLDTSHHSMERSQSPPMTNRTTSTRHIRRSDADRDSAHPTPQRTSRAFIDPQSTARRVSPISQEASAERGSDRDQHRAEQRRGLMDYTRKRRRETGSATDSETESDEDDTFSLYERAVNVPRRRAEKPDQSRHKRARREESDYDSPTRQLQDDIETATPTKQRRSPRVVVSPRRSPSIPYPITTTDRKRWVDDEDNRLVRLIELFGAKWAKIERENSVLPEEEGERRIEGRNQVQLKDRARNLKTKFLREGQPLPRNFDKVTMKAKDYEKLRRMGIAVPE